MSNQKLARYLAENRLPQRLLLSSDGDLWATALNTTASLLGQSLEPIANGIEADVKLCPDDQQSLKIGATHNPDPLSVRGLVTWLNQTPVASHRVLVLQNLERTSHDAMQAWLKVFEEPPPRAQFILTTKNHHRLPTTILSRVTVLPINTRLNDFEANPEAETFLSTSDLITQFQIIGDLNTRQKEDAQAFPAFVNHLLALARHENTYRNLLPNLFQAHQDLQQNVNRRLVLEHLALQLQNR